MFKAAVKLVSVCAFACAALGALAPATAQTKVVAAYGSTSILNAPIWIAKERGFFKKHGLDVELVRLTGTRITAGLVSNSVQFISSSASSPFLAGIAGGDLVFVGSLLNKVPYDFVINPKKMSSFADIKGKTGAVLLRGDLTDVGLRKILAANGVNAGRDVAIVQGVGTDPERISAMQGGSIDFTVVQADFRSVYESLGFKRLTNTADMREMDFIMSGIFTNRAYATANPAVVSAYVRAMGEALQVFQNERDSTVAIVAKYTERPVAEVSAGYTFYKNIMQPKPLVTEDIVRKSLDLLVETNPGARAADPKKFYIASFADRLEAEGAFGGARK